MRQSKGLQESGGDLIIQTDEARKHPDPIELGLEVGYGREDLEAAVECSRRNFKLFRIIMKLKRINDNDRILNGRELTDEEHAQYEGAALKAVEELIENEYLSKERITEIFWSAAELEPEDGFDDYADADEKETSAVQKEFTDEELIAHHRNVVRFGDIRRLRETNPGTEHYLIRELRATQSAVAMIEDDFLPPEIVTEFLEEAMRLRKSLV